MAFSVSLPYQEVEWWRTFMVECVPLFSEFGYYTGVQFSEPSRIPLIIQYQLYTLDLVINCLSISIRVVLKTGN